MADLRDAAERDRRQRRAVRERLGADLRDAAQRDRPERRAAGERLGADLADAPRQRRRRERDAATERLGADRGEAVGQFDRRQVVAVLEGAASERRHAVAHDRAAERDDRLHRVVRPLGRGHGVAVQKLERRVDRRVRPGERLVAGARRARHGEARHLAAHRALEPLLGRAEDAIGALLAVRVAARQAHGGRPREADRALRELRRALHRTELEKAHATETRTPGWTGAPRRSAASQRSRRPSSRCSRRPVRRRDIPVPRAATGRRDERARRRPSHCVRPSLRPSIPLVSRLARRRPSPHPLPHTTHSQSLTRSPATSRSRFFADSSRLLLWSLRATAQQCGVRARCQGDRGRQGKSRWPREIEVAECD